jgi:fatty acid desaturase
VWSSLITRKFGYFYVQLAPRQQRECQLGFALFVALEATMCLLDPLAGLLFWIPMTCVVAPVVMDLHCYTDHVPGNPYDAFHCATYFDVRTRWHRLCSLLDLHNAAYHLTHHRFPRVHWSDLPRVQAAWLDEYKRHNSPVSVGFGSGLLLNPLAFLWSLWRVNATRSSISIRPITTQTQPTQEASWTS